MSQNKKIKHILIDADLGVRDIQRLLKEQYRATITQQYVSLILSGERTGYRYRPMIAAILGKTERAIFGVRKSRRAKRDSDNGGATTAAA